MRFDETMTRPVHAEPGSTQIRRADQQFVTRRAGITTRQCFSFGDHYDPERTGVRALVALNDERLEPGTGYPEHPHRHLDIMTWVLEGELCHQDSLGTRIVVRAGTAQRLTAGTGVRHSETNTAGTAEPLRFLQLWFALDEEVAPSYDTCAVVPGGEGFGWTPIAGSRTGRTGTTLGVPGVEVSVCQVSSGATGSLLGADPATAETFTYVASGVVDTHDHGTIREGDSVRTTATGMEAWALDDVVMLAVAFSAEAPDR